MIVEISYTDITDYIRELCEKNKLIAHNSKTNIRFYPDLESFKGNSLKTPSVILVADTGSYVENNTDSTIETFTAKLLILGSAKTEDSKDRIRITQMCKQIADQFAKRIVFDSGHEAEEVRFIYAPINRIHKTPVPFDIFKGGWGGYELEFTVGAETLMYVDQDDVENDWDN